MTATAEALPAARSASAIWLAAVFCLAVLALAFLWFPLSRVAAYQEINYNEGWNSYRQQMASQGVMLYALPPDNGVTNYPPLSFHLIGLLGRLTGDMTGTGRWISVISFALLAVLAALLTIQVTGHRLFGAYAAILFLIWLTALTPDRVGMNDPQLFGMVFTTAALYLYSRAPESTRALAGSALLFATGLFIKQNLIAFPAAVVLHLWYLRSYRKLGIWLGTLAVACGLFLLIALHWDGGYFWMHVMTPRAYSFRMGWESLTPYLMRYQIPLAACLFWSIRNLATEKRALLAIAFLVANAVGFWFAGGDGVDRNVLFDAILMLAVVTAIAIGDIEPILLRLRGGRMLLPIALAAPVWGMLVLLPAQWMVNRQSAAMMPRWESEMSEGVELLKAQPGPALCENLLFCYEAGKPLLYDAFYIDSRIRLSRIAEQDVVRQIAGGQFHSIELETNPGEMLRPAPRNRFTAAVMQAILDHYQMKMQGQNFVILVPKA